MKKRIIIFTSIIILVVLGITLGVIHIMKNEEGNKKILEGNIVVTKEIVSFEENTFPSGFSINDGLFYYLERIDIDFEKAEYFLNTLDFKTGDKTSSKLPTDPLSFCYLEGDKIRCNAEKETLYDLSLNKIFEEVSNDDYYEVFFKYDNEYWRYANGVLKSDSKEVKIPRYDESFLYIDYLTLKDDTFILLQSANEYYIYDVKENSLTNTHEEKYFKYSDGFLFYSSTNYHIYNLSQGSDLIYDVNGLISPRINYLGFIANDKIYHISTSNDLIEIYNTKTNKVSSLDISGYLNNPITSIYYYEGTLFLTTFLDAEIELIAIDIDSLKFKELSVYDYILKQNKEIEEMVQKMKDKYNINLKIKDEGEVDFSDFSSAALYDNSVIKLALNKIEKVFKKFPEQFFNQFVHDVYKGLNIYLSGSLSPADSTTQAANPIAYTLMHNYSYTIVIDSLYDDLENTVCHELMHAIENNLNNKKQKVFVNWNSLNPSNFSYYNDYNGYHYYEYTPYMTTNNKVYFVSSYSYTYAKEDRGEIFGYMCSEETNEYLKQFPNLYKKAQVIKEELIINYPELKDTVFLENYN